MTSSSCDLRIMSGNHVASLPFSLNLMSTQNDVYKRIQERIQDYRLTPQEVSALDKARGQLQTHMMTGSFAGAVGGLALVRRGRLTRIQSVLVCTSALFFGSQIGVVTGALAGMRTFQGLPEPGKLMGLIREVRSEIIAEHYKRDTPTSPPRNMTPVEQERRQHEQAGWKQQQRQQQGNGGDGDGFAGDDAAMLGDRQARLGMGSEFEKDIDPRRPPPQSLSSTATDTTSDTDSDVATTNPSKTTWSQIRAAKLPNQSPTWAKIRERAASGTAPAPAESIEEEYAELSSSPSAFDGRPEEPVRELPRTREEQAARGVRRVNKYGDPIE